MLKTLKKTYYASAAALTIGLMGVTSEAGATGFNVVAENVSKGTQDIPGLIASLAYLIGALLAVLGVMKIKDHVENPTQTPLKDGAIRLLCAGALLAAPTLLQAAVETVGTGGNQAPVALNKAAFAVK